MDMIGCRLFTFVCLCMCLLPKGFTFSTDQILYQAAQNSPNTHQIWTRQIQDEARISSWQRPTQQVQRPTQQVQRPTQQVQRPTQQVQVCEGPGRQRGRCVPMENCVVRDINQDYVKNQAYFCVLKNQGGVGVCCPDSVRNPQNYQEGTFKPTTSRPNPPVTSQQLQEQPTTAVPNRMPNNDNGPGGGFLLGDYLVCGRNGKKMSRITTGAVTSVRDWPWMAALVYRTTFKQFCGGTIITRRHVLTAAHCFPRADPNEVIVLLGDYDLHRPDESKSRAFSVVQMHIHEDFDVTSYENDIAILTLNASTVYNSYIQPCCLPAPGPRYVNRTAVVTGWGKLEFGGPSSNLLMEVPVPIWEQKQCAANFAQTIFDTNLCAGAYEGGKDACQGDSGGPLVMQRNDERWTIVGIVSWGIRCGEKDKPGVYTKVNDYLEWIAQTIL